MKKALSLILAVLMVLSIVNISVVAADIPTPQATASNDVGGIKVYWNKIDGAVKYNVYRRVGGSSNWIYAGTTTGTKLIDNAVSNGIYYVYSVRAYDEQNNFSAYDKGLTYTVRCVATPKLKTLTNETNGLKLTWSAVSGASYRVYRRGAGSSNWTYLGTTSSTSYTDTKAASGKYWRYTVRAVVNGYYSGFDTNGLFTMRLANPYSIKAMLSDGGISVTWAKINGATGYRVYRRGAGQTYWTYLGATTGNSFKDAKVSYGQYYRYTVRATRGSIYSGFYTEGAVIKYIRDVVTSSDICKINGKLYATYRVGHVKDSYGNYTKYSSTPVIPRIPVRNGDDMGSIAYYNGYVYYTSTVSLYEGTYNLYRCNSDFTGSKLLLSDCSPSFVIVQNKLYYDLQSDEGFLEYLDLKDLKIKTGDEPDLDSAYKIEADAIVCINQDNVVFYDYDDDFVKKDIYFYNCKSTKKIASGDVRNIWAYSYVDGYVYYSECQEVGYRENEYASPIAALITLKRYNVNTGKVEVVDRRHVDSYASSALFFPYL